MLAPCTADASVATRSDALTQSFRWRKGWLHSGETVKVVHGISFTVSQGTIFGVLGPNSTGKTTTKMLVTLLLPSGGLVTTNG